MNCFTASEQLASVLLYASMAKKSGAPGGSPAIAARSAASLAASTPQANALFGSIRIRNPLHGACAPTYVGISRQPCAVTEFTHCALLSALFGQARRPPPK